MTVLCVCRASGRNASARSTDLAVGDFFFFPFLLGRSPLSALSLGGCIAGKVSGGKWERTGEGDGTKQECGGSFEGDTWGGGEKMLEGNGNR